MSKQDFPALWTPQHWSEMLNIQLTNAADIVAVATMFCACIGFLITYALICRSGVLKFRSVIPVQSKICPKVTPLKSKDMPFNLPQILAVYYQSCAQLSTRLDAQAEAAHLDTLKLSIEEREILDAELNQICSITNQLIVYLNLTSPEEENIRQHLMHINFWGYEIIKSISESNFKETVIWQQAFDEHVQDVKVKLNARVGKLQHESVMAALY